MNPEVYDSDYYLRGVETSKSNYTSYSWIPELTLPMARVVRRLMGIESEESLLDFGAARGYFVKAMRGLGVNAMGVDISEWAVENCDPDMRHHMSMRLQVRPQSIDHVWSKDTMEHIPMEELSKTLSDLAHITKRSLFFIVPLAKEVGGEFICPHDEKDPTHVNRFTMDKWMEIMQAHFPGFTVFASYHVPVLKKVSEMYPRSTAFLHVKRLTI